MQAINEYGSSLTYKNLDQIIRQSEHANSVDRPTRSYLKSLLVNFERAGGDLSQALEIELVKQKCLASAANHRRRNLMARAFCAIIKSVIERRRLASSAQDPLMTLNSGTTLHRMLAGVLPSVSAEDTQLTEFLLLERSIQHETRS